MTDHEQTAAGVALKPCPGFNPDLSSRGEGDCLNCGRHQSEHGAPTEAGGAVSEALDDQVFRDLTKCLDVGRARAILRSALAALTPAPQAEGEEPFMYVYESADDGHWRAYRTQLKRGDGSICPGVALYRHPIAPQPLQQGGEVTRDGLATAVFDCPEIRGEFDMATARKVADHILAALASKGV